MTISVTIFKTMNDLKNDIGGETISANSVCGIYSIINPKYAQNTKNFYAWNSPVCDGARIAPIICSKS